MEIRHLRYMLAVANEGHFNLAAKRLHIAQPALSQNIKQLEEEVGVKLFNRTTRRVELTNAGRVFYREAMQTIIRMESMGRMARRAEVGESGSITVGFTETAIFGPLRSIVRRFHNAYPEVQIVTRESSVSELFELLQEGTIDVACSEEFALNANFEIKRLPLIDVVVALDCRHPLARRKGPLSLCRLDGEPFIFPAQSTTWIVYEKVSQALAEACVHPSHEYFVDNALSGIALVAAGLGVCLVPCFAQIPGANVVYRRVIDPCVRLTPEIIWQRNNASPVVANFVALIDATAEVEAG